VDGSGDDFLADPALSSHEHGGIRAGNLRDQVADRLHLAAAAEVEALSHPGLLDGFEELRRPGLQGIAGEVPKFSDPGQQRLQALGARGHG
jgi:hypothetical protein